MPVRVEHVILIAYAVLLGVGGVMGFVKARSRASLVSGLISAVGAAAAAGLSLAGYRLGLGLGALLATVLFIVFGYRYSVSKKFMPGGLLAVVSMIVLLLLMGVGDWSA